MVAMLSMQLRAAWSMGLIAEVGAAGTAWLRLTEGDLIFLTLAWPPPRSVRCQDVPATRGGKTAVTVRQATIERGFATDT